VLFMSARKACLPSDRSCIYRLLKLIELSIYPGYSDIENIADQWFVYEKATEIIGIVAARQDTGEIRHLAVSPNHRRMGIGSQLVRCAMEFLREKHCSRTWVQIRVDNSSSQKLFEKLGFVRKTKCVTSRKDANVKLYRYISRIQRPQKSISALKDSRNYEVSRETKTKRNRHANPTTSGKNTQ